MTKQLTKKQPRSPERHRPQSNAGNQEHVATRTAQTATFSREQFEIILVDEGLGEPRATRMRGTIEEIEAALNVFHRIFPEVPADHQPLIVPLLANGESQFQGIEAV